MFSLQLQSVSAAAQAAEAARKQAEEARAAAEAAAQAAAEAAAEAAAAIPIAEAAFEEASNFLGEIKEKLKASGQGTVWWMDRELIEAMKYMPQKKRQAMAEKLAKAKAEREAKS